MVRCLKVYKDVARNLSLMHTPLTPQRDALKRLRTGERFLKPTPPVDPGSCGIKN